MNQPSPGLPPDVADALARGELIEAMKRLRRHGGEGLQAARRQLEAQRAATTADRPADGAGNGPGPFGLSPRRVDRPARRTKASVASAQTSGLDLDMADLQRRGLSPGEVPRTASTGWTVVVLVLIGYLVFRLLR